MDDEIDIDRLLSDPEYQAQVLAAFGGSESAQPMSLADLLASTALAVSGRVGLTGQPYQGSFDLPWLDGISDEIKTNPDFDPYFGMVSNPDDDRVYMGTTTKDWVPPAAPAEQPAIPVGQKAMKQPSEREQGLHDFFDTEAKPEPAGGQRGAAASKEAQKAVSAEDKNEREGGESAWDYATSGAHAEDQSLSITQVLNLPYTWSAEEVAQAMKLMREGGLDVKTFDDLTRNWASLTQRASRMYAVTEGKSKVTPWDVLALQKKEAIASGTYVDPNRRETSISKTVADITEGQAWATMQSTLSQMLGRDPTDKELREFTYQMNHQAAANPSITKTIQQYKDGKLVSTTNRTKQGFNASDMAKAAYDEAQDSPEYAKFQAGSTYFNAALSALGAIGQT